MGVAGLHRFASACVAVAALSVAACGGGGPGASSGPGPLPNATPTASPGGTTTQSIPTAGGVLAAPALGGISPSFVFAAGAPANDSVTFTSALSAPSGAPLPSSRLRAPSSLAGAVQFFFVTVQVTQPTAASLFASERVALGSALPQNANYYAEIDDITSAPGTFLASFGPVSAANGTTAFDSSSLRGGNASFTLQTLREYLFQFYYLVAPTPSPTPSAPAATPSPTPSPTPTPTPTASPSPSPTPTPTPSPTPSPSPTPTRTPTPTPTATPTPSTSGPSSRVKLSSVTEIDPGNVHYTVIVFTNLTSAGVFVDFIGRGCVNAGNFCMAVGSSTWQGEVTLSGSGDVSKTFVVGNPDFTQFPTIQQVCYNVWNPATEMASPFTASSYCQAP
jgi:hypothetical protein